MRIAGSSRGAGAGPASIRSRLANAILIWALVWGIAVGFAVWLASTQEVDELLDDALQSSSELLGLLVSQDSGESNPVSATVQPPGPDTVERFAWQLVAADGTLIMRSARAPAKPWHRAPEAGFSDDADWRIYGMPVGQAGRMLYSAQTQAERVEARVEVAMGSLLAALAVGLLGHVWLRARVRTELQPLAEMSQRLAEWDIDNASETVLGPAERRELVPVHDAVEALASRLSMRIANERAFAAHAAHSLRTPLAGIDAQLAVALRECPAEMNDRLQRVRGATTRLQGIVAALLGLFRAGGSLRREDLGVEALVVRLPVPALRVVVTPGARVDADPDLLAAVLLNLFDNSRRHGAGQVRIDVSEGRILRVWDDGTGITPARRERLQAALDAQAYEDIGGLGLMLADRVTRAHGGRLELAESDTGFMLRLDLGPVDDPA